MLAWDSGDARWELKVPTQWSAKTLPAKGEEKADSSPRSKGERGSE
jgi:hypothetical protein